MISCFVGDEGGEPDSGNVAETGRLFLRNLPYQATESDLAALFEEYGKLSEVHLILDRYLFSPKDCICRL